MKKLILAIALFGALSVGAAYAADEPRMSVKERMKMFEQDNSNEAGPSSARTKPARPPKPAHLRPGARQKPARPAKPNFLKITARETLNADEDETFTLETFSELITEQLNNNNMFILARVTSQGSDRDFVHYFDANSFMQYYENNQTDPLNRQYIIDVDYYTISRPGQKTFEYLGKHTPENIQTIRQNYGLVQAPQQIQPAAPAANQATTAEEEYRQLIFYAAALGAQPNPLETNRLARIVFTNPYTTYNHRASAISFILFATRDDFFNMLDQIPQNEAQALSQTIPYHRIYSRLMTDQNKEAYLAELMISQDVPQEVRDWARYTLEVILEERAGRRVEVIEEQQEGVARLRGRLEGLIGQPRQ